MNPALRSASLSLVLAATAAAQSISGTSCIDSLGNFPSITHPVSSWVRNPSVDEHVLLVNSIPGAAAVLWIGDSPGDQLNIDLTIIGVDGCFLYVNPFTQVPAVVGVDGIADVGLGSVPLGADFLFQWAILDPAAPRPLGVDTTDAMVAGVPSQPGVFMLTDLDLRDPHITVPILFACSDITDNPVLGIIPAVNPSIETSLTTDSDGDMLLDSSTAIVLRPNDPSGSGGRVDFVGASCTAPIATTVCTLPDTPSFAAEFTNTGACIAVEPGTTGGYNPPVASPSAPCFSTTSGSIEFDLAGIPLTLENLQFGAEYVGSPATALTNGLMKGFVPEATADAILLPATLPLVGGQPLSSLLPGGAGNCSGQDDRDLGPDGVTMGWWFYFNFEAVAVPIP